MTRLSAAEIKIKYGFDIDFDLEAEITALRSAITLHKRVIENFLRNSDIKKRLRTLTKHSANLRDELSALQGKVLDDYNAKFNKFYRNNKLNDRPFTTLLLCKLRQLYAICYHFKHRKIAVKISKTMALQYEKIFWCLHTLSFSAKLKLNAAAQNASRHEESNFIADLISMLDFNADICRKCISDLGHDSGRRYNALARFILIKLAYILEKGGKGKKIKATAYKSEHNPKGYDGTLVKFAVDIGHVLTDDSLRFLTRHASVGEFALEIIPYFHKLTKVSAEEIQEVLF